MYNYHKMAPGGGSVGLCSALCTRLRGGENERAHERRERGRRRDIRWGGHISDVFTACESGYCSTNGRLAERPYHYARRGNEHFFTFRRWHNVFCQFGDARHSNSPRLRCAA